MSLGEIYDFIEEHFVKLVCALFAIYIAINVAFISAGNAINSYNDRPVDKKISVMKMTYIKEIGSKEKSYAMGLRSADGNKADMVCTFKIGNVGDYYELEFTYYNNGMAFPTEQYICNVLKDAKTVKPTKEQVYVDPKKK